MQLIKTYKILNIKILCWVCLVAFLVPSTNVFAANWKRFGEDSYYDSDSNSRNGDIAKINVKSMGKYAVEGTFSFDCIRKLLLVDGAESKPVSDYLKPVYTSACRRWYEFWK